MCLLRNLEGMWILFAPLGGYVSKLGASAPTRLGLFFLHSMSTVHDPPYKKGGKGGNLLPIQVLPC